MSIPFEKPVVYKNFKGVRNLDESYRLQIDENGAELKDAVNVYLTRTRSIKSREGTEAIWSYNTSDLYTNGRDVVGVVDGYLSLIYPFAGWAFTSLIASLSSPWYYESVWDKIFCSNSFTIGYISNNIWNNYPVVAQTYKRQFPACAHLHSYNNIMYGALGNVLIWSDANNFFQVDERNDKSYGMFPGEITMIDSVDDGLWVGTTQGLWYLKGLVPEEFKFDQISDCSVIPGTNRSLTNSMVKGEIWPEVVWVTTSKGIVALGNEGKFVCDMEYTYDMPKVSRGTAYIKRGRINQYVSIVR